MMKVFDQGTNAHKVMIPYFGNLIVFFKFIEQLSYSKYMSLISNTCLRFRYNIYKNTQKQVFDINLGLHLCIDDACEYVHVLKYIEMPIPVCNTNFTSLQLLGDGSVLGFVRELGENIGDAAVDIVLQKLGIDVSIM